jgi:hypothetical protein
LRRQLREGCRKPSATLFSPFSMRLGDSNRSIDIREETYIVDLTKKTMFSDKNEVRLLTEL